MQRYAMRIDDFTFDNCKERDKVEKLSFVISGTQVNGRMENCGGDQRLPPDGDEFPATYQEFSACTSEQYRYVGTLTRGTPRNNSTTSNCSDGLIGNETDQISSSATTSFVEKSRKMVRDETTIKQTNNSGTNGPRERGSSTYVQSMNVQQPNVETRVSSQYVTNSSSSTLNRETILPPEVPAREASLLEDTNEKRSNTCYFSSSNVSPRVSKLSNELPTIVTEKTFEISAYYPKESKIITDNVDSECPDCPPPPLPLTGPPKIGNAIVEPAPQRKYSFNEWRQDDKSEKSVRDKIAMFSSQSSLEAPLFPSQASPVSVSTAGSPIINGRRLSKYKSSEDVFGDEKVQETKDQFGMTERTRSSVDLTDSGKIPNQEETTLIIGEKYAAHRTPSLPKTLPPDEPAAVIRASTCPIKSTTPPVVDQKPTVLSATGNSVITPTRELSSSSASSSSSLLLEFNNTPIKMNPVKPVVTPRTSNDLSSVFSMKITSDKEPLIPPVTQTRSTPPTLARATSFSGDATHYASDNSPSPTLANANGQIARTNSLSSTFRRTNEDMRRQSLNQLIEQRRKGISKLRGLVIPEKNAVMIDEPIIDLPEIKSRDSILLHQVSFRLRFTAPTVFFYVKITLAGLFPQNFLKKRYGPFEKKSKRACESEFAHCVLVNFTCARYKVTFFIKHFLI